MRKELGLTRQDLNVCCFILPRIDRSCTGCAYSSTTPFLAGRDPLPLVIRLFHPNSLYKTPLISPLDANPPPHSKGDPPSSLLPRLVSMLFDALTLSLALLLSADFTWASPALRRSSSPGLHVPLRRRATPQRDEVELGLWARRQKELLERKYGKRVTTNEKRSSGYNLCASVRFLHLSTFLLTNS